MSLRASVERAKGQSGAHELSSYIHVHVHVRTLARVYFSDSKLVFRQNT